MLKIGFFDVIPHGYTPETPYVRPLGGTQSAVCYLTEALARMGHQVWLFSNIPEPREVRGVFCHGLAFPLALTRQLDVAIVSGNADNPLPGDKRHAFAPYAPVILWQQHAADQPYSAPLANPAVRDAWDAFALISDWQAQTFIQAFGIPAAKIGILRNAIAPAFENLFGSDPILPQKPWPPVLAYTSTPFRGLDRLVEAFPRVRAAIPGTRLRLFSGMKGYDLTAVSSQQTGDAPFAALFAKAAALEGVELIGPVAQQVLAVALKETFALAYPNIFPETSCIAVMEALAAGCQVVTSALGALPETTAGFGWLIRPLADPQAHATAYANALIVALNTLHQLPPAERLLQAQVQHMQATATWRVRAAEWSRWLETVLADRRRRIAEES